MGETMAREVRGAGQGEVVTAPHFSFALMFSANAVRLQKTTARCRQQIERMSKVGLSDSTMTAKLYNLDNLRHSEHSGGKRTMMNSDRNSQIRQVPCPPLPNGDLNPKTPKEQPWMAPHSRAIRKQSHSSLPSSVAPSETLGFCHP